MGEHLMRISFLLRLAILAGLWPAAAQVITTVAGTDWIFPRQPLPAVNAPIGRPFAVAADPLGTVFIADADTHHVYRVTPQGMLSIVAGNGITSSTGDNADALLASLTSPQGVAVDKQGNLYIADALFGRIRRVTPGGIITTYAGIGPGRVSGRNGPARFNFIHPVGLAVDAAGNVFFSEPSFHLVRRISPDGMITTVAGITDRAGFTGDRGRAVDATLNRPLGVAVDSTNNLYIADCGNARVRRVSPAGTIITVAGGGTLLEGPPLEVDLKCPRAVTVDASGTLLIGGDRLSRLGGDGVLRHQPVIAPQGQVAAASFNSIAVLPSGDLLLADETTRRVRRLSPGGAVSLFAGNGNFRLESFTGIATSDVLLRPAALAMDSRGALFIRDRDGARISVLGVDGALRPGPAPGLTGLPGSTGPPGMVFDSNDNLYIAQASDVIRVSPNGNVTRVAGGGTQSGSLVRP